MSINGVRAVGDDQQWKRQVEAEVTKLKEQIVILQQQVANMSKRINS